MGVGWLITPMRIVTVALQNWLYGIVSCMHVIMVDMIWVACSIVVCLFSFVIWFVGLLGCCQPLLEVIFGVVVVAVECVSFCCLYGSWYGLVIGAI